MTAQIQGVDSVFMLCIYDYDTSAGNCLEAFETFSRRTNECSHAGQWRAIGTGTQPPALAATTASAMCGPSSWLLLPARRTQVRGVQKLRWREYGMNNCSVARPINWNGIVHDHQRDVSDCDAHEVCGEVADENDSQDSENLFGASVHGSTG